MRLTLIALAFGAAASGCGPSNELSGPSNEFIEEEIAVYLGAEEESAEFPANNIGQSPVIVLARVVNVNSMVRQVNDDDSLGQGWAASTVFVEKIFKGSVLNERIPILAPFTLYYPDDLPPLQLKIDRQPTTLMMNNGDRAIFFLNENEKLTKSCMTPVYNGQAVFRLNEDANKPGVDNLD